MFLYGVNVTVGITMDPMADATAIVGVTTTVGVTSMVCVTNNTTVGELQWRVNYNGWCNYNG